MNIAAGYINRPLYALGIRIEIMFANIGWQVVLGQVLLAIVDVCG